MIKQVSIYADPRGTKIFADGKEIHGVRYFSVQQEVGQELPILKLELVAKEVEITGTAVTEIEKPSP